MKIGKCPVCNEPLAYEARWCPHCGQPFDSYGSFAGYLRTMDEQKKENERKHRRKSFRRLLVVLLLLFILGGTIFLCYSGSHVSPTTMSAGSGSGMIVMPSPTPTVASPAMMTIQHYYDAVNSQNYPVAYYMWDKQGESLANFQSGYSNTKHDGLVFGDIVSQANGTVKVNVTIYATESTASGGTRLSTYKGYYIVGKRGNEWKILDGTLTISQ